MSWLDWLNATVLFFAAVLCCEMWYRRLESQLTAKLKLDEAAVDAMERICGRLEVIGNEIAELNADYDGDEWTTTDEDSDDEWRLN